MEGLYIKKEKLAMLEQLQDNNIIPFLFTFIPALVYSFLIYLTMPSKIVRWKIASLYFLMGLLSTIGVDAVHYMFPHWESPIAPGNFTLSLFVFTMVQIAMLEEGCKTTMFKITDSYRSSRFVDNPLAIMFYAMSVSAGFAVAENLVDIMMGGADMLLVRAFTSVVAHMMSGLILGYFVALGKHNFYEVKMHPWLKTILFTVLGWCAAAFFHGLYDFNIFYSHAFGTKDYTFEILALGAVITYLMVNNLYTRLTRRQ